MQGKDSKPRYVLNVATILSLLDKPSHLLLPKNLICYVAILKIY